MPSLPSIHLYRESGADRVALVSIKPATQPGSYLVQVARGPKRSKLSSGGTFGPAPESMIAERYAGVVGALRNEGFRPSGAYACLAALRHKDAGVRARAAVRLGWMGEPDAVDALLAASPKAVDDVCSIVDALGVLRDARAIPIARAHAARKLLSRRRSGAEALRNLGDAEGLAEVKNRALERLPSSVRSKLEAIDEESPSAASVAALCDAVLAVPVKDRGLAIDTLYEIATPGAAAAAIDAIEKCAFEEAHLWRYVKSVYKRAALRRDLAALGRITHAIEVKGRKTAGTTAKVKSGYDGEEKKTKIFGRATQAYMRRSAWRFLRKLARYSPRLYARAAAEMLIHYTPADRSQPKGRYGELSGCYVLVRALYGGGDRFELHGRSMLFAFRSAKRTAPPPGVREEAFADLWDEEPSAYMRLLSAAKLEEVHHFAAPRVAGRHRAVLHAASAEDVIALLDAPYELTVKLGVEELERRFDPSKPDFDLLLKLLSSKVQAARDLGLKWLRLTAPLWMEDVSRIVAFLRAPDGPTRALAAEVVSERAPSMGAEIRRALTEAILAALRSPEATPGDHDAIGRVARAALLDDLAGLLDVAEILRMIVSGSAAAKAVAGDVLARRKGALDELGIERVIALAQNEVLAVRAAARSLIGGAIDTLRGDPSLIFLLVESEWQDTRSFAFDLLRSAIDIEALGIDGLFGLCDSNRVDVQDLGKELCSKILAEGRPGIAADEVLSRLAQHPHPNMRGFAMHLAERHLGAGADELRKVERLVRAILFDLWPRRSLKHRALDLLIKRGQTSEEEARTAAALLSDYVRTKGRDDFERVMEGLVRIQLSFPEVSSAVKLAPPGGKSGAAEAKAP